MPTFDYTFTVPAPLQRVADFHRSTHALSKLSPPPIIVQLQHIEPLEEGSTARFTLWFGPIPIHWVAVHTKVDFLHGFTDTQTHGALQSWQHTHRFSALDENHTQVHEHIEYQHAAGLCGLFTRLLFNPPSLRFMFAYRAWVTQRATAP